VVAPGIILGWRPRVVARNGPIHIASDAYPSLDIVTELIKRMPGRIPAGDTREFRASCSSLAIAWQRSPSAAFCSGGGYLRFRSGTPTRPGGCSCAPRPRPCWCVSSSTWTPPVTLRRICVFFVLEVPNRSGHLLGTITNPEGRWTTQQIRDLVLDLGERATQFRFLVRDRVGQFTASFDALLADVASRWSGSLLGARERTASPNGSCAQSEPNSPTAC
jgi:hypothetical protein